MSADALRPLAGRPKAPKAPSHLTVGSRRLWADITSTYVLEPHHLAILAAAMEARDRMLQARAAIARHGLLVTDRFGALRANPALAIERDSRTAFYRGIREVGLDIEAAGAPPRLPTAWRS